MLNLQLAVLRAEPAFKRLSDLVKVVTGLLEEKSSIPMVCEQMELMQAVLVIHKLRMNEPLTAQDLSELERLLAESGLAKPEHLAQAKAENNGLGIFVRSLIGLDREAAKSALAGFLKGRTLAANQIEFVNLVVEHLTEHGVMDAGLLYESPFTDLNPQGPEGVFDSAQVDELVSLLSIIRARAVA